MSRRRPDFDELVGVELPSPERERLLKVHELLLVAGPPPEIADGPSVVAMPRRRRRRGARLALAAALALVAFAAGTAIGERSAGRTVDFEDSMSGTDAARGASANLVVYELDDAGNWPMELEVDGLLPPASGRAFQVWLTKGGTLAALCGSFRTDASGSASVPMNAPFKFKEFDGWVIVEQGTQTPLLTT